MERDAERGVDWVHLPVIATVARLLCREVTLQNEYLLLENRTLKSKVPGRLRFTDEERRSLTEAALAMGRSLMREVVSIVKPETILAAAAGAEEMGLQPATEPRPRSPQDTRRHRGPGLPSGAGEHLGLPAQCNARPYAGLSCGAGPDMTGCPITRALRG